ncbi:hypothetical protein HDR60_02040 [bacterium]|nr:hypothetical protein [bacterium]
MFKDLEVYVINLDRSPERMKSMDKRLKALGLSYTRISAVDGKKTEFGTNEVNAKKYERCHGKYITPTEVACFVSHYNVMKEFCENSDKKFALVLEDDMIFADDFLDVLKAILKNKSWDLVKLNGGHSGGNVRAVKLTGKYSLVLNAFHQSKTGAYLINRKAGKSYYEKLLPMFVPIDHEYIKFWKYKIRGFSVAPFPSWEEEGPSTIDYKMVKKNRRPWYKNFPKLAYKFYIALYRLVWIMPEILKNKFTFRNK